MIRIGHGFDVHAFGTDNPLIIGGVKIPFDKGFIAHSDGDVALHALTDALLGAVALGDIGKLFPDTDIAIQRRRQPRVTTGSVPSSTGKRLYRRQRGCNHYRPSTENAPAH